MTDEPSDLIPPHHSESRRFYAKLSGGRVRYEAFRSLEEARQRPDAVAILEWYDGSPLAMFPVRRIAADQATLDDLLADLAGLAWRLDGRTMEDPGRAARGRVFYEPQAVVAGYLGQAVEDLWLDDDLSGLALAKDVEEVFRGVSPRLEPEALRRVPLIQEWWAAVGRLDVDKVRACLERGVPIRTLPIGRCGRRRPPRYAGPSRGRPASPTAGRWR
ncbi:hypothetical protein [Paludisphaera mucosa]|uniref:Uncharacterized protein n=1 Tax=Paludisphaera mucosa TaxID=3030827 RepID=A0ABT6FC36_9BACT|nr:hypothetical protein [Paludisphaera mucosa]MDG3004963.1 hypothetical protein [Paludisphaera mucosa]